MKLQPLLLEATLPDLTIGSDIMMLACLESVEVRKEHYYMHWWDISWYYLTQGFDFFSTHPASFTITRT
jgi:hypothetical protein